MTASPSRNRIAPMDTSNARRVLAIEVEPQQAARFARSMWPSAHERERAKGRVECGAAVEALVILAKAPGRGKTRLANDFGEEAARELSGSFLDDTIELARGVARGVTVAFTPVDSRAEFATIAPEATLAPQPAGDMGERIAAALRLALEGRQSAILIGSDTPQLPAEVIHEAFRALGAADLVVGPASDGGFYLIGLTRASALSGLFDGIEWSTGSVLAKLVANARLLDLTVQLLEEFTDIDDARSLEAALRDHRTLQFAPRTRATVSRLGLEFS